MILAKEKDENMNNHTSINITITQSQAVEMIRVVNRMWERAAKGTSHSNALGSILNKLWNASNEVQWQHVDATGSTNSEDLSLSVGMTKSEITKIQIALTYSGAEYDVKHLNGYLSALVFEASKELVA